MSNVAKGLSSITGYVRRWADRINKRYHRVYDDRDLALSEAIKNVEARSDSYYPAILSADNDFVNLSVGGSALTGIVLTGTNLVGDAEKASGSTENSTGQLTFESILPGERTIAVTITDDGGVAAVDSADADAGTIVITHGSGGSGAGGVSTAGEIKALIDAHAEAKFMVAVIVDTADDIDADETVTVKTTGADPGTLPVVTLGSQSFSGADAGFGFTGWTDTTLTMDLDPTGFSADEMAMLRIRIDDVLVCQIPCVFIA